MKMKKFFMLLIAAASTITTAWGQTGVVSSHAVDPNDATTYVIKGHGNINDIIGPNEAYKFSHGASQNVYKENSGAYSFVWQNEDYDFYKTYYIKVDTYQSAESEPATKDQWVLNKNLYTKNGNVYTPVYASAKYDNALAYSEMQSNGTQVTDFTGLLEDMDEADFTFSKNAYNNVVYWDDSNEWYKHCVTVSAGQSYNSSMTYYSAEGLSDWNSKPDDSKILDAEAIKVYLNTKQFKSTEGLYSYSSNIYTKVTNLVYDENLTYFTGVNFEDLTEEQVKSSDYTNHSVVVVLNGQQFYTKSGSTYNSVSDGAVYLEKQDGVSQYYTFVSTDYSPISFGELKTTVSNYETYLLPKDGSKTFWEDITEEINNGSYKAVKFESDNGADIFVGQEVTMAMTATNVNILDMSATKIDEIISPFLDLSCDPKNPLGTFILKSDIYAKNNTVETLYTPQVTGEGILYQQSFSTFYNLHNLHISEGVTELGKKSIERSGNSWLGILTFPNSLTTVREGAVIGHFNAGNGGGYTDLAGVYHNSIETLTFPAGMELIETGAFWGTCPKDVYFLGVDAPVVQHDAWGDDAYISNNALSPQAATIGTEGAKVSVNLEYGRACRDNYTAQSGWLAMLHYPAACTKDQAAKYTDVTRDYRRVEYNKYGWTEGQGTVVSTDDPEMSFNGQFTYYTPAKETETFTGYTDKTVTAVVKSFGNQYPWGDGTTFPKETYPEGYYGGNYDGGYYDYTVAEQYLWPSMGMAYRATVVAQHDVLWDGVTSIGDGIRNAGNNSFEGDGSEYIGLHQFVFAAADANGGSTTVWEMEKYADGKWHTICLPFNMTKKEMKETFGAYGRDSETNELIYKIKLCKFDAVERNNEHIKLCFNDEQFAKAGVEDNDIVLKAHVSYMIKAEKERATDKSPFVGYHIEAGNPIPTQLVATGDRAATNGKYRFIGNYTMYATVTDKDNTAGQRIRIPQYSYFFSKTTGSYRFQTGTTGTWNPYSSVVYTPEGTGPDDYQYYFQGISTTAANAKVATLFGEDVDNTTQSITITADDEIVYTNAKVYNINGQYVGNSIEGLSTGIYIVNGKKYHVNN